MADLDYTTIDNPYNNSLIRGDALSNNFSSNVSQDELGGGGAIKSGGSLSDITINNFIKSRSYQPKKQGFLIDAMRGYIECMQLYVGDGGIIGGSIDIPDKTSTASFHVDSSGNMWSGAPTFLAANFSVTSGGVLDVTGGSITGGTITGGTITGGAITGGTIDGTTITGGTITIGSGNNVFKADLKGIYVGNAVWDDAPFRVNMNGDVWADSLTLTGYLKTGEALADVNTSLASYNSIVLPQSTGTGSGAAGYLRWADGSRMWSDSNSYIGINAVGGFLYLYCNSNQEAIFRSNDQVILTHGAKIEGFGLNVGTPNSTVANARFTGIVYFNPTSNNGAQINGGTTWYGSTQYSNSMSYNSAAAHNFFVGTTPMLKVTSSGVTIGLAGTSAKELLVDQIHGTVAGAAWLGSPTDKWTVHCNGFSACPLPVTKNALTKIKKTKHGKLKKGEGHYGDDIDYLDIKDAPPETKVKRINKETGKEEEDIDIIKTTAFLYSCVKEMATEIEDLKSRLP